MNLARLVVRGAFVAMSCAACNTFDEPREAPQDSGRLPPVSLPRVSAPTAVPGTPVSSEGQIDFIRETNVCGDGRLDAPEQCDDANRVRGDGCNESCQLEPSWNCPTPGRPCVSELACGDGILSPPELCDDGNVLDGDGCSGNCFTIEDGWWCPAPGRTCRPRCGDGRSVGDEECDDGNTSSGDGCSAACRIEEAKDADAGASDGCDGGDCEQAECGDGIVEGDELCDDGSANGDAYGGCSVECRYGPHCGDGRVDVNAGETCDLGDANEPDVYLFVPPQAEGCTRACRRPSYCGDGVVDYVFGELCDAGPDNGLSVCRLDCTFRTP